VWRTTIGEITIVSGLSGADDEGPDQRKPTARVEDRDGDNKSNAFWTRIGCAWPHKDGKGSNVVWSALPTNGRLVLREFTEEDAAEWEKKNKRTFKR
jgi:hypothetical protein